MDFGRTVRSVFQALTQMVFARSYEKIALTDKIYFGIPKMEITLVSLIGEAQTAKLSVDEARQILRSIKQACDMNDVMEIQVGDLTWTTDARVTSGNPDQIVIKFGNSQGSTRTSATRADLSAATEEFVSKFGAP
jgi:hypothetical protein